VIIAAGGINNILASSSSTLLGYAISACGAGNDGVLASGGASNDSAGIGSASIAIIAILGLGVTVSGCDVALLRSTKVGVITHFADVVARGDRQCVVAVISSARVAIITADGLRSAHVIDTRCGAAGIGPGAGETSAGNAVSGEVGVDARSAAKVARIRSARVLIITALVGEYTTSSRGARIYSAIVVVIASDGDVSAGSSGADARIVGASIVIIAVNGVNK